MGFDRLADEVFEAVIFDLDGTLIDSTPAVIRSWTTWAGEYGFAPTDLLRHHGTPSASVVRAVMPKDLQEAGMRRITELELADVHDIAVLPGRAKRWHRSSARKTRLPPHVRCRSQLHESPRRVWSRHRCW